MQSGNKPPKMVQEGINMQIENQYQIIDFYDKKGEYQKMIDEVEQYVMLCMQTNRPLLIEDTYIWLFQHHALSPEVQLRYGCLIFSIEDVKPKINLESHFQKLAALYHEVQGLNLPLSSDDKENLKNLAKKVMQFIDRQAWKKDVYTAIGFVDKNPNAVSEYKRYTDNLIAAGDIYYRLSNLITYAESDAAMNEFARYLCAKSVVTPLYTQEWDAFIAICKEHAENEFHSNTYGDLDSNPV